MSPEQRYWMLEDIEALLEEAALGGPIVLCIDDLQWADAATAAALRTLPRRLRSVPVGWILAARTGPASAGVTTALSTLQHEGGERLTLGPLDARAVALVTADVLRGDADDALLEVAARAGGSPFLLTELLEGLRDENLVRVDAGVATLVSERLPDRLAVSMRDRLARTSDAARRVAVVAASLGRRFSLDQVAAMLDEPAAALLDALDELIHSSVLIERDGDLEFRHDLTRDAVRNSVPVPGRRGLDRQAAAVLLAAGALAVEFAGQVRARAGPSCGLGISPRCSTAWSSLGARRKPPRSNGMLPTRWMPLAMLELGSFLSLPRAGCRTCRASSPPRLSWLRPRSAPGSPPATTPGSISPGSRAVTFSPRSTGSSSPCT